MSDARIGLRLAARYRIGMIARRQSLHRGPLAKLVDRLPSEAHRRLGIDELADVRRGAIQVGTEPYVLPDYVHVAVRSGHPHAEARHPAGRMMLPRHSVDEIVAIGVLDHLPPFDVPAAVAYWHRSLRPGGRLVVGVRAADPPLDDDGCMHPQHLWACQINAPEGATSPLQLAPARVPRTRFNRRLLAHTLACHGLEASDHDDFDLPPVHHSVLSWPGIVMSARAR